jgi:hypothetical protein
MKVLVLPLVGGAQATFFIGNSNLVIVDNKDQKTCMLCDSVHNNGGWTIAKPYTEVVKDFMKLMELTR